MTTIMPIPQIATKGYAVKRSKAGLGLFAMRPIKRGTYIIEYVGRVLRGKEMDPVNNKYLFETSRVRMIDGSARSNTARYINHACKPNAEPVIFGGRVFIKATHRIESGEEITYDYGKEYFDTYIKPYGCRCKTCLAKK